MERCIPNRYWRGARRLIRSRTLAVSVLAVAIAAAILTIMELTQTIYIVDGDRGTVAVTAETDYRKILMAQNISVTSNDILVASEEDEKFSTLRVLRSFPVQVTVDGATTTYQTTGQTVAEFLAEHEILLGLRDQISLPAEHTLNEGDSISIVRVMTRSRVETEVIPYEVIPKNTSVIAAGRTRLLEAGYNGERQYVYQDIIEDGEVAESILLETTVTKEPKSATMLVGNGSAISGLDYSGEFPLDANGIPVNYTTVLRGQHATGYYAKAGAWGAALYSGARGMPDIGPCVAGTIAVNPNEIPYGTRMYIRSADGSFIYGYAIANDTGTGMMQGVVDVDLFYESFLESQLNGRRIVDIYILD